VEANMIGIAAGLTIGGKIHLQELSLTSQQEECMTKFVNLSPTLTKRENLRFTRRINIRRRRATHQILEDIGLMKMLPGMTV
jgi:transketolase C-terminal domain/subunit